MKSQNIVGNKAHSLWGTWVNEVLQRTLLDIGLSELEAQLRSWGEPYDQARAYARDIWRYLYEEYVADVMQMTSIPSHLRNRLVETLFIHTPVRLASEVSSDGSTQKDLLQLADGARIESVVLKYRERYTVCVSTQVGCACGCVFCATGDMGFVRQLSSGEILAQVLHFQRTLHSLHKQVSNVVFMGMGEPLLNEDQTIRAIRSLIDPRGPGFAPGRITLSTVGIVPGIVHLADLHPQMPIKLAVSLHAATNDLRDALMPINKAYPLEALFEASHAYAEATRRRIFFAWIMIDGVNDSPAQAEALATRLQGLPSHVNLIQLNPTSNSRYRPSSAEAIEAFAAVLDRYEIPHTMRQRRGAGIEAGCGQLYALQRSDQTLQHAF